MEKMIIKFESIPKLLALRSLSFGHLPSYRIKVQMTKKQVKELQEEYKKAYGGYVDNPKTVCGLELEVIE